MLYPLLGMGQDPYWAVNMPYQSYMHTIMDSKLKQSATHKNARCISFLLYQF